MNPHDTLKHCSTCNQHKPESDFHKNSKASDGLCNKCKSCAKQASREWYANNRERAASTARTRYEKNRETTIQRSAAWASANRERRREIQRAWAERNAEYAAQNLAACVAKFDDDPAKLLEMNRRARALRRTQDTAQSFPLSKWIEILDAADGHCVYCESPCERLQMDHFMPIARGGLTQPENMVPCCRPCNSSKSSNEPHEWLLTHHGERGAERVAAFMKAIHGIDVEEVAA